MSEAQEQEPRPDHALLFACHDSDYVLPRLAALSAAEIPYDLARGEDGWEVRVSLAQLAAAQGELSAYDAINRGWPPRAEVAPVPAASVSGLLASFGAGLALLLCYRHTGSFSVAHGPFAGGCADSAAIRAGEWWRSVTALTLHADISHVLGNVVCAVFFGQGVCSIVGAGLGWALILLTGISGNLVTAWMLGPGHISVGASTATFGALGILSALQVAHNLRRHGRWRGVWDRTWIPLGAGVALLALLGVGPRADLTGHFCGFFSGVLLGACCYRLIGRPPGRVWQAALMCAVCACPVVCWQLALR